jgi:pilus assembly protein CpaC
VSSPKAGDVVTITVAQHQAELITLPQEMTKVVIADRKIAGVVRHDGRKVSVVGHNLGSTDIRFMNGNRIVRQVNFVVTHDLPDIRKSLQGLFPAERVGVESIGDSIALTGVVSDAETARNMVRVVQKLIGQDDEIESLGDKGIVNLMKLRSGQQVMLRVQVGEIRRDTVKNMGLGAHAVITQGNAVLGALEKDALFKVLAEPNLVAISGETADFLAGGEVPLPVPQGNGTMSVMYKPFGVGVKYTPFVLSENRIRLVVESEVSELTKAVPLVANTYSMPGFATRRAKTTVELAPGESFMIAGLMRDNHKNIINEVPGLASIPVLSALFRSTEFQRDETELVIAVTPYLVDPIEHKDLSLPTDGFRAPSGVGMFLFGELSAQESKPKAAGKGLEGTVGYMLD